MVRTNPLTLSSTPLTPYTSVCFIVERLLTAPVPALQVEPSLTLTVNTGFALTIVNIVNRRRNSMFFNAGLVNDDC